MDALSILGELLDAVNAYRSSHSAAEAGESSSLLNDRYVNMLVKADEAAKFLMAQPTNNDAPTVTWESKLDERQLKEVSFARLYASSFKHGTDGHNRLLLIALMADLLDKAA